MRGAMLPLLGRMRAGRTAVQRCQCNIMLDWYVTMHNNASYNGHALWQSRMRMAMNPSSRIVVAGAGSVGCYLGGCLAAAGRDVTLLLRPALAAAIDHHGLRVRDLDGGGRALDRRALRLATEPCAALGE